MMDARLEGLVRALRPRAVAVIGDVMLDRYVRGQVIRISPEAPIQVLDVTEEWSIPGGAANVAMKALELGSIVSIVGLVGDDVAADELRTLLAERPGLTDSLLVDTARTTTVKTRFVARQQQLLRVDREHRALPLGTVRDALAGLAYRAAASADAVILEDYGKGVLCPEVIRAALDGARPRGIPIVVDPNGRDYSRYSGCTLLTPNLHEVEIATEKPIRSTADLEAAVAMLIGQTGGAALAVTRESEGISLFRPVGDSVRHTHVPTRPARVFDVAGAGDAVAATLAIAMASGVELADACALANLAGRVIVLQFGLGSISIDHLLYESRESIDPFGKVCDLARASERVRELKRSGGRVVFTNGCFDILHYGHAYLLRYARSLGDFLVVGLNSDASIRRLKGPNRPCVNENDRSNMLALYPFVDLIVLFEEDTPLGLIEALRPDVLLKGDDYTPDTIVGRDLVESYGGRVEVCPRLDGLSTTALAQKLRTEG
jgi:D-beta-D-heptose 7-phosphate kinase/D-beta-D-heptose 1-phosphate adenosyltransferase